MFRRIRSSNVGGPQVKRLIWFSPASKALTVVQKAHGFPSDMFIAAKDLEWRGLAVKPQEKPFDVSLSTQLELHNLDNLNVPQTTLDQLPIVDSHTSYVTRKPYTETIAFELGNRATIHGFSSKWWISVPTAKKNGFTPKAGTQSSILLLPSKQSVFNASQLQDPEKLIKSFISGGTARTMHPSAELVQHCKKHNFQTGVYFAETHAKLLQLEIKAGADPSVFVSSFKGSLKFYNVAEIVGGEELITSSGTSQHTLLIKDTPIQSQSVLSKLKEIESGFPQKLWVTAKEVEDLQLKLAPNAKGVDLSPSVSSTEVKFFNVEQLVDPSAGFKAVGTLVR